MRLGNGKWENTVFNSRMQPTKIGLGTGVASQDLLKLEYEYGATPSVNNGNVTKQTITVPGVAQPFIQTYTYDELNRLTNAEEIKNSVQQWEQTFTYDRFGNRNFNEAETTTLPKNCGSAPSFTVCAADKKIVNPSVNTANNRLSTSDNYAFDAVGNTTGDAEGRTFVYDAENKQVSVSDGSGTVGEYSYDGDGKRIKKYVPDTGETTIFVYDAGGKLIQEHSTIVQPVQDAKTVYTTNDHLGSPRINTDATGQVISRHDYHPFGEEVDRTSFSHGSDTIRKQFTGYERDGETGLDYAQARYLASGHGRFSSPDPLMASGRTENPQTWNRYVYVGNNPLVITDPTGEDWIRSNETNADGLYTYHDVYGKELKKYLAGGNYSRVDFGGAESSIIERNGVPIYEMFAKGGGQEITTPSTPVADAASQLASAIGNSAPQKIATVAAVAATGVAIGTGVGVGMAVAGTAAGTGITTLGLTEAGTTVGTVAAANPEKTGQILQGAAQIPQKVLENFNRFASKVPQNARANAGLSTTGDGGYRFTATSAGNVPGSRAVYEKLVDAGGRTIGYLKTTLDPNGNIVHVKDKLK